MLVSNKILSTSLAETNRPVKNSKKKTTLFQNHWFRLGDRGILHDDVTSLDFTWLTFHSRVNQVKKILKIYHINQWEITLVISDNWRVHSWRVYCTTTTSISSGLHRWVNYKFKKLYRYSMLNIAARIIIISMTQFF